MLIEWSDDLVVGIPQIDSQHHKLIEIANRLSSAIGSGSGKQMIAPILEELADYVGYHFSCEEEYMRRLNYPWLKDHERQHEELIRELTVVVANFEKGDISVPEETMELVNRWVINHIRDQDTKIGIYARERDHNTLLPQALRA